MQNPSILSDKIDWQEPKLNYIYSYIRIVLFRLHFSAMFTQWMIRMPKYVSVFTIHTNNERSEAKQWTQTKWIEKQKQRRNFVIHKIISSQKNAIQFVYKYMYANVLFWHDAFQNLKKKKRADWTENCNCITNPIITSVLCFVFLFHKKNWPKIKYIHFCIFIAYISTLRRWYFKFYGKKHVWYICDRSIVRSYGYLLEVQIILSSTTVQVIMIIQRPTTGQFGWNQWIIECIHSLPQFISVYSKHHCPVLQIYFSISMRFNI